MRCFDGLNEVRPPKLVGPAEDSFRPEGPFLTAQAEGLGTTADGNGDPERVVHPWTVLGHEWPLQGQSHPAYPFPRPSAWAVGTGPSGRKLTVARYHVWLIQV